MNSSDTAPAPLLSEALDLSVEPAAIRQLTPEQKERLTEVLDGYLCKLEKGLPPPREGLLEANSDLAGPLNAYFASLDELHDMAAGFQGANGAPPGDESLPTGDERRLGDFRLLREVGRGGMGVVYEAQQISLGRRVALKVLPFAAVLDSRQLARFKHEAQSAAQLNHPNIVSVFAVGVERGVHYYAMQFIDGQPLDRALTELREMYLPATRFGPANSEAGRPSSALPVPACKTDNFPQTTKGGERSLLNSRAEGGSQYFRTVTRLGIQAAAALHAAHESGVIHRDIKPSNLLLDGNGKLWVTDFGLARRQSDPTLTRTGDLVGTLRYMSPEQALGQNALIDHRTDIYSLGATLYELLTLEPAFPGDEGPALIRQIERNEPRSLRRLQPKIPVDLETVILKGMAKRREDRYATAQEFADDLQRVVDNKPTVARPPSLVDRAARWAQRHREIVAVAGLVVLLALLGLTVSTLLILGAERKTNENFLLAEKRFREAHDMVEVLGTRFAERLAHVPGAAKIRQNLLRQTLGYYQDFVAQSKNHPELQADLAMTYSKIASLSREIGSDADAIAADGEAIQRYRDLAAANPHDSEYRRRLGACQNDLALVLQRVGRIAEARQAFAEAIRLQEEDLVATEDPGRSRDELALFHSNLGMLQKETGDTAAAIASITRAVGLQEQLHSAEPEKPDWLRSLAKTLNKLGSLYAEDQPDKAIEFYEKAAALQKKAVSILPDDSDCQIELALTCNNLGTAQSRQGDVARSAESFARVVDLAGELERQAPADKLYRHTLAAGFSNLGLAESRLGHSDAAEPAFRKALAMQETLVKLDAQDLEEQSSLGGMYNNLGIVMEQEHRFVDAAAAFEQAVTHQRQAVESAQANARYRQFLSKHYFNYARMLRQTGRLGDSVHVTLARRELWPSDPQHLFSVAEELAADARFVSAGGKADITADKCGAYAVETLKQALAAGWKPAPGSNWTQAFLAVKNRTDFRALTRN